MTKTEVILGGWYEAACERVEAVRGNNLADGGSILLKLEGPQQKVKFYVKPIEDNGGKGDGGFSLMNVAWATDWPYKCGDTLSTKFLEGRRLRVLVRSMCRNGRVIPVIVQLSLSTRQLFSWSGDKGHDE